MIGRQTEEQKNGDGKGDDPGNLFGPVEPDGLSIMSDYQQKIS